MLRVARRRYDVLHETITLDAEAERRAIRQTHDAHRRRNIRQREREEMRDVQRWCHGQKVPELVPGALLHLDEKMPYQLTKKGREEKRQTLSLVAVLGSMTLRMSRVSWVREVPTWPCFMTKDLGTLSREDVEDCGPFKWVRFLRLRAIDDDQVAGHPIQPGRDVKIHLD